MPPSVLFGLILALTIGLLFHSVFGRRLWQLPLFLVSAIVGVFAGQVIAVFAGWEFFRLGNVAIIGSSAGALLLLAVCWFFTAPLQPGRQQLKRRMRRAIEGNEQASA